MALTKTGHDWLEIVGSRISMLESNEARKKSSNLRGGGGMDGTHLLHHFPDRISLPPPSDTFQDHDRVNSAQRR